MNKNIATICNQEIDTSKIKNPRLKQIIDSYRTKDGFMFFGLFGSSKSEHHEDYSTHTDGLLNDIDSCDWAEHTDTDSHTDHDDYSEYKEYDDHTDHTDAPYSDYSDHSEYSESEYHTDSRNPNYRR